MPQRIQKQVRTFPAIEAERHLVQIGQKMLGADLVPASHDAALQKRECRFDGVRCDARTMLVSRVFPCQMVNDFVFGGPRCVFVCWQAVGNNHFHIGAHVLFDVFSQRAAFGILSVEESQITVTLTKADDDLLRFAGGFRSESLQFSADIGFVHLDSTVKHRLIHFFHGGTDAMAKVPSRLIGTLVLTPDRALELQGAHALLGFAEQKRREKPLLERQVGVIKNCASGNGELVIAILAIEELLRRLQFHDSHLAARALNATGPAEPDKQFAAFFVSVEQLDKIN